MVLNLWLYLITKVCLFVCLFFVNTYLRIIAKTVQPFHKHKAEYSTISVEFASYLAQRFSHKSQQIQLRLIEFCKLWPRRWFWSFEILHSWFMHRLIQTDDNHFKEIDDINFFSKILRYNDKALKETLPTIDAAIKEIERICKLDALPKFNNHVFAASAIAKRMAVNMSTNVKQTLVKRFISKQREIVDAILLNNRNTYRYNGNLLQEDQLHFLSFSVRKIINKWEFKEKKKYQKKEEIKIEHCSDDLKSFIQKMNSILPLCPSSTSACMKSLTYTLLKSLHTSQLLMLYRDLYSISQQYLSNQAQAEDQFKVDWRILPSSSNSIQSIPFDEVSFTAVFPYLVEEDCDMYELFDLKKVRTNKTFIGIFNTDGTKLNLLFDPSEEIRLHNVQIAAFKAALTVNQFSRSVINLILTYLLTVTSTLTRFNKLVLYLIFSDFF